MTKNTIYPTDIITYYFSHIGHFIARYKSQQSGRYIAKGDNALPNRAKTIPCYIPNLPGTHDALMIPHVCHLVCRVNNLILLLISFSGTHGARFSVDTKW